MILGCKELPKLLERDFDFTNLETLEIHTITFKYIITKVFDHPLLLNLFFGSSKKTMGLPLLSKSVSFFTSSSGLVRTTVQQFVLQFLETSVQQSETESQDQSNREALKRYLGYFPFANFYIHNCAQVYRIMEEICERYLQTE